MIVDIQENRVQLTDEFELAYRFINETNQNIFLTGKAGSGKTTFLKYLRGHSRKNIIVTAPTGIAAINAGGVTIHSLFQLPFTPYVPSKEADYNSYTDNNPLLSQLHYTKVKIDLLQNLDLLVIDEVSMVASHTIDAIDIILRSIRRKYDEPFGGVQLLFIGDLYQLPPVVKDDWGFLKEFYPSFFFFDSQVLRVNVPLILELKRIFRQHDDSFIQVLNAVRNNELDIEHYETLNSRYTPNFNPHNNDGYITLTTHNDQADAINKEKLMQIPKPMHNFVATISGKFQEQIYPAEYNLELKEGAQVMFLKNDTGERKYFNGKIGTVTKIDKNSIHVLCKGDIEVIEVKPYIWKNLSYTFNHNTQHITEVELGQFSQYPLRLAWAITIHKSQGLTFERLMIDAQKSFAKGQMYVALSRCTSLEGLILTSPLNNRYMGADRNVGEWLQKNQDGRNLTQRLDEERQIFMQKELTQIFTWGKWFFRISELKETLQRSISNIPPEYLKWVDTLITKQSYLQEIANRFKDQLASLIVQNQDIEKNEHGVLFSCQGPLIQHVFLL